MRLRLWQDFSAYDNPGIEWASTSFVQPQAMLHDRYLYDRATGQWTVDRYLDDVEQVRAANIEPRTRARVPLADRLSPRRLGCVLALRRDRLRAGLAGKALPVPCLSTVSVDTVPRHCLYLVFPLSLLIPCQDTACTLSFHCLC